MCIQSLEFMHKCTPSVCTYMPVHTWVQTPSICTTNLIFYSTSVPLKIVVAEVPKKAVFLGRFHIDPLGTLIGCLLVSKSANTCKEIHKLGNLHLYNTSITFLFFGFWVGVNFTSLTWKYVPLSGNVPLIAVLQGICIIIHWFRYDKLVILHTSCMNILGLL